MLCTVNCVRQRGLDDVGREQIESQNSGHIGLVDALGSGQFANRGVGAVFQFLLPAMCARKRLGNGSSKRVFGARCGSSPMIVLRPPRMVNVSGHGR